MSESLINIDMKEIEYFKSSGIKSHYLILSFSGKDCNIKIMNMLRRICHNYIPIYAFAQIVITENTTVAFDNDIVSRELSFLPVCNVDPELYILEPEYWKNVNYYDPGRKKHPNEKNVELYVNASNKDTNIVKITTNDANVYINGKQEQMYDKKNPILLIELNKNQSFKCHMKAVLGIGEEHARWKSARNVFYEQNKNDTFTFTNLLNRGR